MDGESHLEIISSVTDTTKYPTIYAPKKGEMSKELKDILSGKTKVEKKVKKKTEENETVADTNETVVSDTNETTNSTTSN